MFTLAFFVALAFGAPVDIFKNPAPSLQDALGTQQIAAFKPYSYYAAAAYSHPSLTMSWTCGENCAANAKFRPVASGGDGGFTQYWYVGYDPTLNEVIVAHQGTNLTRLEALLVDAGLFFQPLDSTLFPDAPPLALVHSGFAGSHVRVAAATRVAVQRALQTYGTQSVTVVGHSLGAAIGVLNAIYLSHFLSSVVTVKFIGYGMPRVGDGAWAKYADATSASITRINNQEDPIPRLPPLILQYRHTSGEIHIQDPQVWVPCHAGRDNLSPLCSSGDLSALNVTDHSGPYDGVIV
ncbi:lipase [Vararia minispora EC-137]|uniref:Lipase n=1 Tax=Vararia minispora EC-137 TaxID=1314806 RepID=A0ACB8QSB8_9AGAM|nr:lipase [Vararia minispora EC-137]